MQLLNDRFTIDGVDVLDICQEFETPLYVYNASKIISQYKRLTNAFSDIKVKIKYACKSNTNLNVLKLLKNEGCGLDTVSINEVKLGLLAGFEPSEILYTPNCVSFSEIKEGIELGVRINIDNISILEQFGHEFGSTVPVCIRINPHLLAGGNSHIQTGHIDSKFGISIHQLRLVQRVVKANNINVEGLHMHTGSDIVDSEVFVRAAEVLFDIARDFNDLKYIDLGSGFKVAYRNDDLSTDIEELGVKISARFKEYCDEIGKELELWFEPGKFLVSESGYFFMKVNVIKQTVSTVFAGVDSGLNHLIRPMLYDGYHRITNVSNPSDIQRVYSVVGYICETDTFGYDRKLSEVREGDVLAIHNAGAYGFTMASNYNSRLRPAEVMILNGKAHLIRKRETFDDLTKNIVDIDLSK